MRRLYGGRPPTMVKYGLQAGRRGKFALGHHGGSAVLGREAAELPTGHHGRPAPVFDGGVPAGVKPVTETLHAQRLGLRVKRVSS